MPIDDVTQTPAATPATPAAEAQPEAIPSWVTDHLVPALEKQTKQIENWSQQVVKAQSAAPAPAQPAASTTPPAPDDAIQAIAEGNWVPVDQRIANGVQQGIRDTLGPYYASELPEKVIQNETTARAKIDGEFGTGTFDDVLKVDIDSGFGDRVADKAVASQYRNALDQLKGRHFSALLDRKGKFDEATAKTAAEEAEKVKAPFMPGSGFQMLEENELSDSDQEKIKALRSAHRPNVPSDENAAKLRDLMLSKGPDGVSLDDFNEAFPVKPAAAAGA